MLMYYVREAHIWTEIKTQGQALSPLATSYVNLLLELPTVQRRNAIATKNL